MQMMGRIDGAGGGGVIDGALKRGCRRGGRIDGAEEEG